MAKEKSTESITLELAKDEVQAIYQYHYMRWYLRVYAIIGEDNKQLMKEFCYKLDEKHKLFDDYLLCQEFYKDLEIELDEAMVYEIQYEPF